MATNMCSRTKPKYVKPMELAETYSLSKAMVYKLLAMPIFKDAIFKPTEKSIRVDADKAHEIMKQHFNSQLLFR